MSDKVTQILSGSSIFPMMYRGQSNEINIGTRPSMPDVSLTSAAKVLFCDASDLQYQILLINMIAKPCSYMQQLIMKYHKVATWCGATN